MRRAISRRSVANWAIAASPRDVLRVINVVLLLDDAPRRNDEPPLAKIRLPPIPLATIRLPPIPLARTRPPPNPNPPVDCKRLW